MVAKPGPKKPERANLSAVRSAIQQLEHGSRRTAGTTRLQAQFADCISRRRFQELVAEERANQFDQMKRIQWLVPGVRQNFSKSKARLVFCRFGA